MAVNLIKLLDEWLMIAQRELENNVKELEKKEKDKYLKSSNIKKLMEEKEKKQEIVRELEREIKEISNSIYDSDPYITFSKAEEIWIPFANQKLSDAMAEVVVRETKEYKNKQAFISIRNKFQQMMALAVWAKEQRAIIWKFYALDWLSLWIALPIDIWILDIEIKDWVINVVPNILPEKV